MYRCWFQDCYSTDTVWIGVDFWTATTPDTVCTGVGFWIAITPCTLCTGVDFWTAIQLILHVYVEYISSPIISCPPWIRTI